MALSYFRFRKLSSVKGGEKTGESDLDSDTSLLVVVHSQLRVSLRGDVSLGPGQYHHDSTVVALS